MIEDDSTPSERLEQSIKTPYPTDSEDGEKWNALLTALASEFDEHEQALADVRDVKFVDTATEAQLEKLADLFELDRRTSEDVDEFRARIKVALRTQTTSATLPEIREMIAVLMGIDPSSIELQEPDNEILWLEPRIPADAVGQSNVRPNFLDELLTDVSAAGVNANAVLLTEAGRIRVLGDPVTSTSVGVFDFVGLDAFNGQGAFGAGDDDAVRGATVLAAGSIAVTGDPVSSTETEDSGFGSSAFGVGSFDGVTDDDEDVRGTTALEAGSITIIGLAVSSVTTEDGGFGSDEFDGQGAFGAGDDDAVRGATVLAAGSIAVTGDPVSSTETEAFGFGSGSFDGSDNFDGL